jgi:hypothetical protein
LELDTALLQPILLSLLLLLLLLLVQVSELEAVQHQQPPPAPTPVDSRLFEQLCSTPPLQVRHMGRRGDC